MTQEEKELLLKVLCELLPYRVNVEIDGHYIHVLEGIDCYTISTDRGINYPLRLVKPYLRPLESMTEEEMSELRQWGSLCMTPNYCIEDVGVYGAIHSIPVIDWFNSKYFDCYGLIPMGLALPAPEDMYNF